MSREPPVLFGIGSSAGYAEAVAAAMGLAAAPVEERTFEDGEHKLRPSVSVRGRDCYVLLSLYGEAERSVDDKLCRLLFFVATLRDAGAARVSVIAPYLAYARKDRRTKPRDPVATRYLAQLLEAMGVERVVTLEVHNLAAFQNAYRCATVHLESAPLFRDWLLRALGEEVPVVLSPDAGGMKRAARLRDLLAEARGTAVPLGFMEKQRSGGELSGSALVGEVRERTVVILDDLISTGTTLLRAAQACRRAGARRVWACATHGVFAPGAEQVLAEPDLERIVITDSVPADRLRSPVCRGKLVVLAAVPLIAEAVRRLAADEPLSPLTLPGVAEA